MRLNELAAVAGFKPRFQKHDAASVDIMRWVWVATREYFSCRVSMGPRQNLIRSKNSAICTCATANSLNSGHLYFVAHVAQISRGSAQANAVNSTDLAWSRLVRDQEDGGSNPLAPTNYIAVNNLRERERSSSGWLRTRGSMVKIYSPQPLIGRALI